jgi:hypothetical protein
VELLESDRELRGEGDTQAAVDAAPERQTVSGVGAAKSSSLPLRNSLASRFRPAGRADEQIALSAGSLPARPAADPKARAGFSDVREIWRAHRSDASRIRARHVTTVRIAAA